MKQGNQTQDLHSSFSKKNYCHYGYPQSTVDSLSFIRYQCSWISKVKVEHEFKYLTEDTFSIGLMAI